MLRSRIVQTLNVPHPGKELFRQLGAGRVRMPRLGPSLAAALLTGFLSILRGRKLCLAIGHKPYALKEMRL